MFIFPVYVCIPHVCSAHRVQKRAVDLMELKLQIAIMLDVGAVTKSGSSTRTSPFNL